MLAIESVVRLQRVPLGLDPTDVLTFRIALAGPAVRRRARARPRDRRARRIASPRFPASKASAATTYVPITGCCSQFGTTIEGRDDRSEPRADGDGQHDHARLLPIAAHSAARRTRLHRRRRQRRAEGRDHQRDVREAVLAGRRRDRPSHRYRQRHGHDRRHRRRHQAGAHDRRARAAVLSSACAGSVGDDDVHGARQRRRSASASFPTFAASCASSTRRCRCTACRRSRR